MLETTAPHSNPVIPPPDDHNPEHRPRQYRPDIEGLRAIAVLLVVIYHAHLLGISGGYLGVDIFFVISGFLITRQLVSGVTKRGVHELPGFYARRIRRLLPASCLVVVATIIAAWYWAPATLARATFTDAIYTTFYGLNYRLAYNGTQYLHQGDAVSPLQHFWSLGVEEQFYVVWPVLIVLVMLLPKRIRTSALIGLLSAVFAVSLWYSITTSQGSTWAYFGLHTRAWELAAGGLVALAAPACARLPRWLTNIGAWAGVAVIIACAWYLDDNTVYPGSAALIPVLACALVIACGCATRHHTIERLFAEPAIQGLGKISYSWYLWHWPMLVLLPMMAGESLNWVRRLEIVGLSLLFAVITYHVVENPARRMKRLNFEWVRTGLGLAAVVVIAAVIAANILPTAANQGVEVKVVTIAANSSADKAVGRALQAALVQRAVPSNLTPTTEKADTNYNTGCISDLDHVDTYTGGSCIRGDLNSDITIGLFGDSHALHWADGLSGAAKSLHERLVMRTKAGCPFADVSVEVYPSMRPYTECDAWRPGAIREMIAQHPDLIFVSQADGVGGGTPAQVWESGTRRTIARFQEAGIQVIYLRDIPHQKDWDAVSCVAKHLKNVSACSIDLKTGYQFPLIHKASYDAAVKAKATIVNPEKWFCYKGKCPATVSNVLIYRDNTGHMTARMSQFLTPVLTNMLTRFERAHDMLPPTPAPSPSAS